MIFNTNKYFKKFVKKLFKHFLKIDSKNVNILSAKVMK